MARECSPDATRRKLTLFSDADPLDPIDRQARSRKFEASATGGAGVARAPQELTRSGLPRRALPPRRDGRGGHYGRCGCYGGGGVTGGEGGLGVAVGEGAGDG